MAKQPAVRKSLRLRRFSDPAADVVWAGIMALEIALQHEVLRELASAVVVAGRPNTPAQKVRAAVAALRDAFDILGHSPSVRDYNALRSTFPDLDLPPSSNICKWLGGGWNECLTRCLLPAVSDGDFTLVLPVAPEFSEDELVVLVAACAQDLGRRPTLDEFKQWGRRPDVTERFQRVPRCHDPFYRHGGYLAVMVKAGVATTDEVRLSRAGRVLPASYRYENDEMLDALREVTERLAAKNGGRSPRMAEYDAERLVIQKESLSDDASRTLPHSDTIRTHFKGWDEALTAAGLEPLGGRGTVSNPRPRRPKYTPEEKKDALRQAWTEIGQPFIQSRYSAWREGKIAEGELQGKLVEIPSTEVICAEFEGWRQACLESIPGYTPFRKQRRGGSAPEGRDS